MYFLYDKTNSNFGKETMTEIILQLNFSLVNIEIVIYKSLCLKKCYVHSPQNSTK